MAVRKIGARCQRNDTLIALSTSVSHDACNKKIAKTALHTAFMKNFPVQISEISEIYGKNTSVQNPANVKDNKFAKY